MVGTRGRIGRLLAMAIALGLALALVIAGQARAGKYSVAQCGWYVGADAAWADTTGGAKFRGDAWCAPGPPADPFDGSHLKTLTRDGQGTVSGTRFGRWRWTAPPGTGITQVSGTWWQALHDGIEQRLGTALGDTFTPFATTSATDLGPRPFVAGFATPQGAFEDRLLCARAEARWCSLDPGSWSALRAVTLTLVDDAAPFVTVGGALLQPGWHRGAGAIDFWGGDVGGGIRYGETTLDGARVNLAEYPCALVLIGGEWRGTQMHPCPESAISSAVLDTTRFSDGPHAIRQCITDVAGNVGCTPPLTALTDNTPPAHPRSAALAGGEGWRRSNDCDRSWANPDQGSASPVAGAGWRLTGSAGYDTGVQFAGGRDRTTLADLTVPAAGGYQLSVWLRDEAGNEAPASAVTVPLRFDDVAPRLAFSDAAGAVVPERIVVAIEDPLSGPAAGQIVYRRSEAAKWIELPTKLVPGAAPGQVSLSAPTPELAPGTYLFRAEASDAAGNSAATTLRADGTQMAIAKAAPLESSRAKARLFARLDGHGRRQGDSLTVRFGAGARLRGRLVGGGGAPLPGRELRVLSRPSRGALSPVAATTVRTDYRGDFALTLGPGPSRQVTVSFDGDARLEAAAHRPLDLRVRSGVTLEAAPLALRTGQVLRLSGRVADGAAPIPRRGKLVAIQYLETETGRWRPVLVTRSDHDGRFHARYRFRYVSGSAAIQLRATALAEEAWPYAPGSSAPVTVRVGADHRPGASR